MCLQAGARLRLESSPSASTAPTSALLFLLLTGIFFFNMIVTNTFFSQNFRYIFITRPLHYPIIMTTKRALLSLPLCWLIAITASMLSLQGFQYVPVNICSLEHGLLPTYIIIFSLLITFPLFMAIIVYSTILHKYRTRQERLRQLQKEISGESDYKLTFQTIGRKVQGENFSEERYLVWNSGLLVQG